MIECLGRANFLQLVRLRFRNQIVPVLLDLAILDLIQLKNLQYARRLILNQIIIITHFFSMGMYYVILIENTNF